MKNPSTHSRRAWERTDLEAVNACPVCDGRHRTLLYEQLGDQVFDIAGGIWSLQRCVACSSAFLDPRPASHAIGRAYKGDYYTHATPVAVSGWVDHTSLASHARVRLDPRRRMALARQRRHLRIPHIGARLLDIGCGSGQFVIAARARGWDAIGIDTDADAVAAGCSVGLPLSTSSLEELADAQPGSMDAVTMEHVLEHVPDPLTFLQCARRVLGPSGQLWLATPNLEAAGHARFEASWKHLDPPRHLVLFTATALDGLLRTAGFRGLRVLRSASGSIDTYAHSWRISRGLAPRADVPIPCKIAIESRVAGLRSLVCASTSEELIRLARAS